MPIYEFACPDCDHRFEELVRISASPAECRACGSVQTVRLMSVFSVRSVSPGGNAVARAMTTGAGDGCCGGSCACH